MLLQSARHSVTETVPEKKTENGIAGVRERRRERQNGRGSVAGSKTGETGGRRIADVRQSETGTVTAAGPTTPGIRTGTGTVWSAAAAPTAQTAVVVVSCTVAWATQGFAGGDLEG